MIEQDSELAPINMDEQGNPTDGRGDWKKFLCLSEAHRHTGIRIPTTNTTGQQTLRKHPEKQQRGTIIRIR